MISSYTLAMLRVIISTLLLLPSPIVSRQIPINVEEHRENVNNQRKNNVDGFYSAPSSRDEHFKDPAPEILVSDDKHQENLNNLRKNNVDDFYTPPSDCDGYFRDPLEILGAKFPESRIVHLCKANVYMFADSVSDVTFPKDASKLCRLVCKTYQDTMFLAPGVSVSLINSNCDYTGDTIIEERAANATHEATCPDLSTSCVCAYNVRCNRKTRLVKYILTPNEKGYLKVSASDCDLTAPVT